MSNELNQRIRELPENLQYLAEFLLKDIEKETYSNVQIQDRLRREIREIVLEENDYDS